MSAPKDLITKNINNRLWETKETKLLEEAFRSALSRMNQKQIDWTYHKLCGHENIEHFISNIHGDPETLIKLAQNSRELNKTITAMKKQPNNEKNNLIFFVKQPVTTDTIVAPMKKNSP